MTLAAAAVAFRAALGGGDYQRAFQALLAASKRATAAERDAAIAMLLDPAGIDHPEVAGFLCVASGALVEDGASTIAGLDRILDQLADGAALIAAAGPALADASLDATDRPPPASLARDERRWIAAFQHHVRGAMARLARDVAARNLARAHPRLAPALRALAARVRSRHLHYLLEIVDLLDDEPIVVVDLAHGEHVARYRAFAIRSGFHLMAVLDLQDPHVLVRRRVDVVQLRHGYHPWTALARAGERYVATPTELVSGEQRARDLPAFEGVRTVLRAEAVPARSFATSVVAPIHEAMREELVVEREYPRDEARALLARMAAAPR